YAFQQSRSNEDIYLLLGERVEKKGMCKKGADIHYASL
ncbi:MAG: hypothetical protein H6Q92_1879, partial [Nitrospirae bacterium]|nr:hypothetical protein [Nitrospirota bacterium]